MSFEKPYPPDPITYAHYDALVDALEARLGPGAKGFNLDATLIANTRGNTWEPQPGNVQQAIDDLYSEEGGAVFLPRATLEETQPWVLDQAKPVYLLGRGICWHEGEQGTLVRFQLAPGVDAVQVGASEQTHFGGMRDLALVGVSGTGDLVHLGGVTDWMVERVYLNQAKAHGVHVEAGLQCWNLWFTRCLVENSSGAAIRLDAAEDDIVKVHVAHCYFYWNGVDVEAGALGGVGGRVRYLSLGHNQHFQTQGPSLRLYRRVEAVNVVAPTVYQPTGAAVEVGDDGEANKCSRLNLVSLLVEGGGVTPVGVDLGGYTSQVVLDSSQIWGCGQALQTGPQTSDIVVGEVLQA